MLLTRQEMSFDFEGGRLDPERDRDILAWVFNQFLYGEVTGIQCGHWLYNAPDLESARFLAKQAIEEFQHVNNFLEILKILERAPEPPHRVVRFLSTGMMPDDWSEHVALEMAQGEGQVLTAMYALIDTLEQIEITDILKRAVRQEERHVDFGERWTKKLIEGRPALRFRLLGLTLVSLYSITRLGTFLQKRTDPEHPVLGKLSDFLKLVVDTSELRMQRMGLIDRPLKEYSFFYKISAVLWAYSYNLLRSIVKLPLKFLPFYKPTRLTDTYLADPEVRAVAAK